MSTTGVTIFGIVNVTRDSFSDGGRYLDPRAAVEHALRLVDEGADVIDLGAASSHPEAEDVSAEEEIRRLEPVLGALVERGVAVSVDSWRAEVQRFSIEAGAAFLNDIRGFAEPECYAVLAASTARLVAMYSISGASRATREATDAETVFGAILEFFDARIDALVGAGVARERLIVDPGMGLFLGANPEPSVMVLRRLGELRARYGLDVLISVSRKSVVGALAGEHLRAAPAHRRDGASLAAELFAVQRGATMIRTHEPRLLRDALAVSGKLREA